MHKKPVRHEGAVTGGVLPTSHELRQAIAKDKKGAIFNYEHEVPVFIRALAKEVEHSGRYACEDNGVEVCELACIGVDLTDTITPVSEVDASITSRCPADKCSRIGVLTAQTILEHTFRPTEQ